MRFGIQCVKLLFPYYFAVDGSYQMYSGQLVEIDG